MIPQESATSVLPGQDKPTPSGPTSEAAWFVVSCGLRLSEVGLSEIRKPQVRFLSSQSNSLNFKTQKGYQRRLDRLPFTARIERAQFHRARSASKKGNWPLPAPFFSILLGLCCEMGGEPIANRC